MMSRNNDSNEFDFDAHSMSTETGSTTTSTANRRLFIKRKRPVTMGGGASTSVASVAAIPRPIPPSQQTSLGVSSPSSIAGGGSIGSNNHNQQVRLMIRRRRKRGSDDLQPASSLSFDEEEEDDDASNDSIGVAIVRGAGTSSLAVQDAGTHRMLHDDCEYLCCTILNANTPQQAIEAAIDLGILLSSRNTRSVLFWKQGGRGGGQQKQQKSGCDPPDHDEILFDDKGKSSSASTRPTSLQSVLDVIAKALAQKPKAQRRGRRIAASAVTFKTPATISSEPNDEKRNNDDKGLSSGRTKSARKRLKLQSQSVGGVLSAIGGGGADGGGSLGGSATTDNVELGMSIEMRQVIASILYFISWDCTMSEKNSIAAMGVIKSSRMARNIRMDILRHGEALRAMLNLVCISSSSEIVGFKAFSSSSSSMARSKAAKKSSSKSRSRASAPTAAHSSSPQRSPKQRRLVIVKNPNYSGSVLENSGKVSTPTTPRSSNSSTKKAASAAAGYTSPRLSSADSLSYIGSAVSSVSYQEDDLKPSPVPQHLQPSVGASSRFSDPTAAGRRGRRHKRTINEVKGGGEKSKDVDPTATGRRMLASKRQQQQRRSMMQSIAENDAAHHGIDDIDEENLDFGGTIIPSPPVKRAKRLGHYNRKVTTNNRMNVGSNFSFASSKDNFTPPTTPPRRRQKFSQIGKELDCPDDGSVASASTIGSVNSLLSNRVSSKLNKLLSKVRYSINIAGDGNKKLSNDRNSIGDRDDDTCCSLKNRTSHNHGMSWVSMIALESFDRIVKGKDEEFASCLEPDEIDNNNNGNSDDRGQEGNDDNNDILGEQNNPIMTTNKLLSENQVIPILGRVMSRSLQSVSQKMLSQEDSAGFCKCEEDDYCWAHWEYRLSILASLMDEACLFHKQNRISFCESNPFSFVDRDGGLIFRIVVLLRQYSRRIRGERTGDDNKTKIDGPKLSGIMLLALRTLTSLTHDNELAAEQLTLRYPGEGYFPDDDDDDEGMIRGVEVLAELIYELERDKKETKSNNNRHLDEEFLHRFDSTNFCLNTLSNIVDAGDVRRTLAEIAINRQTHASSKERPALWLKWFCRWFVIQTQTFQDAIFALGKQGKSSNSKDNAAKKSSGSARELEKNEEDRLVAAGNGCILLACLMKEPKEIPEDPESTNAIRQLILGQLPRNDDDKDSSPYTLIINTLKAFCNFYYYSVGDLSLAVVAPVKGLIVKLQELEKDGETQKHEEGKKDGN